MTDYWRVTSTGGWYLRTHLNGQRYGALVDQRWYRDGGLTMAKRHRRRRRGLRRAASWGGRA